MINNWVDVLLLILIIGNTISGFWGGLIYKIGTLIGGLLGLVVASRFYDIFHGGVAIQILTFLVIFAIIANVVGLFFKVLNRVFNLVAIIPGMKFLNRLGGGIIGFAEAVFFWGLILLFVRQLDISAGFIQAIDASRWSGWLMDWGRTLLPLFPEGLNQGVEAIDKAIEG